MINVTMEIAYQVMDALKLVKNRVDLSVFKTHLV